MLVPFKSTEFSKLMPHIAKWWHQNEESCIMPGCRILGWSPNCADFPHSNSLSAKASKTSVVKGTHSAELGNTSVDHVKPVSKMVEIKHSSPSLSCFRSNLAFANLHFFAGETHYFRMIVETVSFVPLLWLLMHRRNGVVAEGMIICNQAVIQQFRQQVSVCWHRSVYACTPDRNKTDR